MIGGNPIHRWETASPDQTLALGQRWGRSLSPGLVLGLVGPLGAGKTHLVKGIVSGNADTHTAPVTSPTFTLVHEYPGRVPVFHLDAYRLASAADLARLGFDEMVGECSTVIVEWADRVRPAMPENSVWVTLEFLAGNSRRIVASGHGELAEPFLWRISQERR